MSDLMRLTRRLTSTFRHLKKGASKVDFQEHLSGFLAKNSNVQPGNGKVKKDPDFNVELLDGEPLDTQLITTVIDVLEYKKNIRVRLDQNQKELLLLQKTLDDKKTENRDLVNQLTQKDVEIEQLRDTLTDQSLKIDQISEDLQLSKNLHFKEVNELKHQLSKAASQNETLLRDMEKSVLDKDRKIITLENKIRDLKNEQVDLIERHEKIKADNKKLVDHISGFAEKSLLNLSSESKKETADHTEPVKPEPAAPDLTPVAPDFAEKDAEENDKAKAKQNDKAEQNNGEKQNEVKTGSL